MKGRVPRRSIQVNLDVHSRFHDYCREKGHTVVWLATKVLGDYLHEQEPAPTQVEAVESNE